MKRKTFTFRPTPMVDRWITDQATKQEISKNTVIQILVHEAIERDKEVAKIWNEA